MTKVWKNAQGLYAVAKQYFGNWEKALVAAGIKPLRQQWNRQRVIDLIREGLSRGDSLATIWSSPGLQSAAAGYFGGRRKALLAAGFPSPELRHWTKGIVVEAIRHRHQQGLPMINVGRWDSALLSAAHRHYGSWTKAMAAAGLESCQRKWSEQRMLAWVRSWYRLPKDQRPKRDVNLYAATLRRFGNARSAMLAAGIDPDQNKWSEQRVIDAIQDRYVKGLPMKYVRCEDLALISAAKRFFGSWHKAMQAAGVLNAED
jgi:hypothetical protein